MTELCALLDLGPSAVRALLRILCNQGMVRNDAADPACWMLTGDAPRRRPRTAPASPGQVDGMPRMSVSPAVQTGMRRDPMVAYLFGWPKAA